MKSRYLVNINDREGKKIRWVGAEDARQFLHERPAFPANVPLFPPKAGLANNHKICAKAIGHGLEPKIFWSAAGGKSRDKKQVASLPDF